MGIKDRLSKMLKLSGKESPSENKYRFPIETRYVRETVNIRNKPQLRFSKVIGSLNKGSKIEGRRVEDFFEFEENGTKKYVYFRFTSRMDPNEEKSKVDISDEKLHDYRPRDFMVNTVKNDVVISWEKVENCYFEVYEREEYEQEFSLVATTSDNKYVRENAKRTNKYFYYVRALRDADEKIYSKNSKILSVDIPKRGYSTLKNYLKTAMSPIGANLYVWCGGYGDPNYLYGGYSCRIGLRHEWREFFEENKVDYDYTKHHYKVYSGLDCAGFVAFVTYNNFRKKDYDGSFLYNSYDIARMYSRNGFGSLIPERNVTDYVAGDIMAQTIGPGQHTWMVVGPCEDGSVVLVHSIQEGIKLNGTPTKDGNFDSQAINLAREYMKKYYPDWYKYSPQAHTHRGYLTDYSQMRWDDDILSDPDGFRNLYAKDILKDIFEEI